MILLAPVMDAVLPETPSTLTPEMPTARRFVQRQSATLFVGDTAGTT